jgi:DNA-binding CsgD family transcriptional regulator
MNADVQDDSRPDLQGYAAHDAAAQASETERRRLAALVESEIISPLNLLLAQANAYEQTFAANPQARLAVSVLTNLARQVMQQARDLKGNLHPPTLETLGLEPALEALANQVTRAHGLQVALLIERQRERLPPQIELALYRITQDMLTRATQLARASWVSIRLERRDDVLRFSLADNGIGAEQTQSLEAGLSRLEQLGAAVALRQGEPGSLELSAAFNLAAPADLTAREMEVIQRLASGLTNKEIALALDVSARTVNFHLDNIYSKLGVSTRTEAAVYALRQGWVRQPPK